MSSHWGNMSVPWPGTGVAESPNVTAGTRPGQDWDESLAPPCHSCCCGLLSHVLAVVFMGTLALAIIIGNVVTLAVFMQTRRSRTPQGYLKVSLALADMTVGVLVVPFSVFTEVSLMVTSVPPVWFQGRSPPCQPCKLIGPVFAGCTFVSISTIFLMTVERSVAVLWPLQKDAVVTRRRTLLLVLLCWAGSFLLALTPLFLSGDFTLEYNECSRMCNYAPRRDARGPPAGSSVMLIFPVFDFTLLGGTLAVNALSFTSIRRYTRKRRMLSAAGRGGGGGVWGGGAACLHRPSFSDIKAAKTIGMVSFTFTASFSPIAVFVLGHVVGHAWCTFSFFAFWMLTANSCCNVIIYSVRDKRFRRGVRLFLHRGQVPPLGEKS